MFFSRADAVTLRESKCRASQKAACGAPPASVPLPPLGRGAPARPGGEGQRVRLCTRGRLSPFSFSRQATYDLLISRINLFPVKLFWGASGPGALKANS